MNELETLSQILSTISFEYEKNLIDRHFEPFFNKIEANKQLACEILEAFPLPLVLLGDVFFTEEGF